ncbi:hypothetical protein [Flagellimonas sediminis]|uniref:Uncharacterized protein n=1 Tax=Flagellimonas sediminis TaxID=2696468 RepID=A0A6I5KQG9_9FLAO|nr:hypothetical protein [Allomuricauda sediminis]NDV43134.1 hypothetical protein [Allomuricauda sediminis]
MKIVTSTDLKQWADRIESKSLLPLLIRKLILAGIDIEHISKIDFPFGDDTNTGGYDGDLESEKGNLFVPTGNSVWEFGVTERKKEKANNDYEKRKKNPLGKIPKETTYVSVTLKKYTKRKNWAEEKKLEKFWADVRFYDAIDMEHWLELAPSVEIWLARHLKKPVSGVQCGEDYWQQWSTKGSLKFPHNLIVGSRESQTTTLIDLLKENIGALQYVKANTKEESLAFILASIESQERELRHSLQNVTLVVENPETFRQLSESKSQLILIPKFRIDDVDINAAINKKHKVIIPVSNSFTARRENLIVLPVVKGEVLRKNLETIGINREQADLLAKNSGKDISVLRRSLDFSSKKPSWLETQKPTILIPFLLLSRFDSSVEGDREIIEKFSKTSFDEYEKKLNEILHYDETPIYNVGKKWRLISHSDSWLYLSKFITQEDLNKFYEIAVEVLSETNPKYDLNPEKRYMASFYNAVPKYSSYLKKGICESLIVLAVLSKNYDLSPAINPEHYVNKIVDHILSLTDKNLLRSHANNLTLLAEAAPDVFLNKLEKHIDEGSASTFFEEEETILNRTNDLPYLLWALEAMAWMPQFLTKVVRLLARLINLSPKELPTLNTPYNSLVSIFRIWYPQTNANADERVQVLGILKRENPNIAFSLFNSLVYSHHDHASMNQKMRWRLFSETREVSVTTQEVQYMHNHAIDSMIELTDSFSKVKILIEKLPDMNWTKIDQVLECVSSFTSESEENKALIYHSFRKIIGHHRTYLDTNWALPESLLSKMEGTAITFKPTDTILANSYLFEDHHPISISGVRKEIKDDFRKREEELNEKRKKLISQILKEYGVEKIIELAKSVENPYLYAHALASIEVQEKQESKILDLLRSKDEKEIWFIKAYISAKERNKGRDFILKKFGRILSNNEYSGREVANYLLSLVANAELFKYLDSLKNDEIERAYWLNQDNWMANDSNTLMYAAKKFSEFKRPISALNVMGKADKNDPLPIKFVIGLLDELDLSQSNEPNTVRADHYSIRKLFEDLHDRDGVDEDKMAEMEFKFLFVFDRLGHGVQPRFLYLAISKNPEVYMELIKSCYKSENEKVRKTKENSTKEYHRLVFENAYSILSNFNLIPGLQKDGSIIKQDLQRWIEKLRELATKSNRLSITDQKIGELLARYPNGNKPLFFPEIIYDIIENLNTKDLKLGFSIQVFNRQGATTRLPDMGGSIERARAELFNGLAEETKISHPNVSEIFKEIATNYETDAKREDIEALHNIIEY